MTISEEIVDFDRVAKARKCGHL